MSPLPRLDALEARVLGVLIEKELTTPDQYPLSINALTSGCNQKSNRDPVMALSEAEVRLTLDGLRQKGLAGSTHPSGGRVERYHHGAREVLEVEGARLAILAELLLRGAQSPGDLRGRASRMSAVASLDALDRELEALAERGLVRRLPPAAGSRAARWTQLLAPEDEAKTAGADRPRVLPDAAKPREGSVLEARVEELAEEVARLRRAIAELASRLGEDLEV